MHDREMQETVLAMAREADKRPEPSADDFDKPRMMAVVSADVVMTTAPIMGFMATTSANYAIIRAAYELGRAHGGLTLMVAQEGS